MTTFRIVISLVSGVSWLMTMMLLGQKLYPDNMLAELSFGAAGICLGLLIGLSIEYVALKLKTALKA